MLKFFSGWGGIDIDSSETFAPMAKIISIRLVLSITTSRKWIVHQMDVKGAFYIKGSYEPYPH